MSSMGAVYLDLQELGYEKVLELEKKINAWKGMGYSNSACELRLMNETNIHRNTAIMLVASSENFKCSNAISDHDS